MPVLVKIITSVFLLAFAFTPLLADTITVDTARDDFPSLIDGKCSLREAIEAANTNAMVDTCAAGTNSGSDEIVFFIFTPAVITLVEALPTIEESLFISGLGAKNLTIDGDNQFNHFTINPGTSSSTFIIRHITLKNAFNADPGGSVFLVKNQILSIENTVFDSNVSAVGGGAIMTENHSLETDNSALNIVRTSFINNETTGGFGGGAIRVGDGFDLDIDESTFVNNRANLRNTSGGAIMMVSSPPIIGEGNVKLSTFTGNEAAGSGSAITVTSEIALTVLQSTIVGNTSDSDASGNGDGAIFMLGTLTATFENSIVAGNIDLSPGDDRPDVAGTTTSVFATNGFNFIGNNDTGLFTSLTAGLPNDDLDYIGTSAVPLDPVLDPIADNGGLTQTMAISSDSSPVLDKGNCPGEFNDQRTFGTIMGGVKRAFDFESVAPTDGGDNCDIGAHERGAVDLVGSDADWDNVPDSIDTCPDHYDPLQQLVCELEPEVENDGLCFPVNSAVICL